MLGSNFLLSVVSLRSIYPFNDPLGRLHPDHHCTLPIHGAFFVSHGMYFQLRYKNTLEQCLLRNLRHSLKNHDL